MRHKSEQGLLNVTYVTIKAQMCLFINVYFSVVSIATLHFPAYNFSFLLSVICIFLDQNNLNLFLLQDGVG